MEEERNCYVYGWFNNDWCVYFYVGRGRGNRYKDVRNRSRAFKAVINRFDCEPIIFADELTAEEAEQVENNRKHYLMFEMGHPILDGEAKNLRAKCQAEGIAAMPVVNGKKVSARTGRGFGRPKSEYDVSLMKELSAECNAGKLTVTECCKRLGISRGVWYREVEKLVVPA